MNDTPDLVPGQAQLFWDDAAIADHARLTRCWHQARKHAQPVLVPDRPWEGHVPVMFGTVLRRAGLFQMWYCTSHPATPIQVCYAESDDGLHWRKPDLGLCDWRGSVHNNICLQPRNVPYIDDVSVIDDPADDAWPLKALFWEGHGSTAPDSGIRAARSRDGRRWEVLPGFVLPFGDRFNAMPQRENGRVVVLGRTRETYAGRHGAYGQDRLVFRTESEDLVHWTTPILVNKPDLQDPAAFRIYSQTAFRYEGRLLGFLERMHVVPDVLDPEVTWSADGLHWQRSVTRAAFIERGAPGTWDGNWLCLGSGGPLLVGGRLWFHYSGRSGAHATPYPVVGALGLATLRRDGFASLDGEEEPGFVTTRPLVWRGAELLVNADPRRSAAAHPRHVAGCVGAELREPDGTGIAGFGEDQCVPVTINTERDGQECYAPIRWRERTVGELTGRPLCIRFHIRDARLFAFKGSAVPA